MKNTLLFLVLIVCFLGIVPTKTFAVGGIIRVNPPTGTITDGQTFTVKVEIDGGGIPFNAAKAQAVLSPSLRVSSVTLGDCNFAFVHTPTQSDPSFAGVILGGSSNSCTLYTLALQALKEGLGSITFVDGSIKAYEGAEELFVSAQNAAWNIQQGSGTMTASSLAPTQPPTITKQGIKLYTLIAQVNVPAAIPASSIQVVLDPNQPQQRVVTGSQTILSKPIVFDRVSEGVHTLAVFANSKPISSQIITVGGPNGTIVFGVSEKKQSPILFWALLGVIIVILLGVVGYFLYKKLRSPKATVVSV